MMTMRGRVLVVDDKPGMRETLIDIFAEQGLEAAGAGNAADAYALVAQTTYDLVLLDLCMPEVSGWKALSELHTLCPDMPIVLMSAVPGATTQCQAQRRGAQAILTKPLDIETLLRLADKLLSEQRPEDRP